MGKKRLIVEEHTDESTGMRILVDDRGQYHCFMPSNSPEIKVVVEPNLNWETEKKRLINIMERLRQENNWLWGEIMKVIIDRKKKGAATALDELEKSIKEKQRL